MADWNNSFIPKAHATTILVIKRLLYNELDEEVKENVLAAIKEYLKKFNVNA